MGASNSRTVAAETVAIRAVEPSGERTSNEAWGGTGMGDSCREGCTLGFDYSGKIEPSQSIDECAIRANFTAKHRFVEGWPRCRS
ncbi:hypothetical protein GCM10009741_07310 [Kribbella lupini]|uniref:Uncharacterized protein n=1 Tax=Kribbella lupini TaxID=291602 RepID=A0ABN2A643_9ACTN